MRQSLVGGGVTGGKPPKRSTHTSIELTVMRFYRPLALQPPSRSLWTPCSCQAGDERPQPLLNTSFPDLYDEALLRHPRPASPQLSHAHPFKAAPHPTPVPWNKPCKGRTPSHATVPLSGWIALPEASRKGVNT